MTCFANPCIIITYIIVIRMRPTVLITFIYNAFRGQFICVENLLVCTKACSCSLYIHWYVFRTTYVYINWVNKNCVCIFAIAYELCLQFWVRETIYWNVYFAIVQQLEYVLYVYSYTASSYYPYRLRYVEIACSINIKYFLYMLCGLCTYMCVNRAVSVSKIIIFIVFF